MPGGKRKGRRGNARVSLKRRMADRKLVRRFVRSLQGADKAEMLNAQ